MPLDRDIYEPTPSLYPSLPPSLPIGAYTLCTASAGFRVLTFEPMKRNARAIREGVCRNQGLKERVVLLEKGLGDKEQVGVCDGCVRR